MQKSSLLLCLLMLFSCADKNFDTVEELNSYISDSENGYNYQQTINGIEYTLEYRPTDLIVAQETNRATPYKEVEQLRKKYMKYIYFNLLMSKDKKELLNGLAGDKNKFGKMVTDLAFEMGQKVHLITPKQDTIPMLDYIYPRMYGMSDNTAIMLVYPRENDYLDHEYLNFIIEDLGMNTGKIKFKIATRALTEEPRLRFKR